MSRIREVKLAEKRFVLELGLVNLDPLASSILFEIAIMSSLVPIAAVQETDLS